MSKIVSKLSAVKAKKPVELNWEMKNENSYVLNLSIEDFNSLIVTPLLIIKVYKPGKYWNIVFFGNVIETKYQTKSRALKMAKNFAQTYITLLAGKVGLKTYRQKVSVI